MHPPPASPRRPLIAAGALVVLGTALFTLGAWARLTDREPALAGFSALTVATAGFACTLAGGLWLRRLVGR